MLEITQAPVDQFGRCRGRAGSKVAHFGEDDRIAASHRVAGDAAAIDATADHKDIGDVVALSHVEGGFLAALVIARGALMQLWRCVKSMAAA